MWEQKSSLEMSKTKTITKTTFLLGFFLRHKAHCWVSNCCNDTSILMEVMMEISVIDICSSSAEYSCSRMTGKRVDSHRWTTIKILELMLKPFCCSLMERHRMHFKWLEKLLHFILSSDILLYVSAAHSWYCFRVQF